MLEVKGNPPESHTEPARRNVPGGFREARAFANELVAAVTEALGKRHNANEDSSTAGRRGCGPLMQGRVVIGAIGSGEPIG